METITNNPQLGQTQKKSNQVKHGILHGVISFIFMFIFMTLIAPGQPITQGFIIKGLIVWGLYGILMGVIMTFLYKKYPFPQSQQ